MASVGNTIVRIAAKGDGVDERGQHFDGTAPGDVVFPDKTIEHGPHHVKPSCRHFQRCGACQLQHCDDKTLADFVRSRVINPAKGQGIEAEEILPVHLSLPKSRRRAIIHAVGDKRSQSIGFRKAGSHQIVDMRECYILHPQLFETIKAVRSLLVQRNHRFSCDINLTVTDQGVDCSIKNLSIDGLDQTEAMLDFARTNALSRLTLDQGYGPETLWEPDPVTITLSGTPVSFPSGAFLQATADGEAILTGDTKEWLDGVDAVADLFSGLGTFAFALANTPKILAVEAARDTHLSCKLAAKVHRKPVYSMHRDLFRNPMQAEELNKLCAVILDPPRAGARDQVEQLSKSTVEKIIYISCNPSSWARDARKLVDKGYKLRKLRPVGQFRWSTHVELASLFTR